MSTQMPLIPVSPHEFKESAYRLARLLQELDDARASFDDAKKSHKEHVAALTHEIVEYRATIRRAEWEAVEGLMNTQVDALMNAEEEQRS